MTEQEAINIQQELRQRVILFDELPTSINIIAGVDVEYDKETDTIAGAIVLMNYNTLEIIELATHCMQVPFPYIPGLFSFREMPVLLEAYKKLSTFPDLIICDGHGWAHPRRFGLACHLGVILDKPTIGCGKTRLFGHFEEPGQKKGAMSALFDDNEHIGNVLRTQTGINPVFISAGHKISLATATSVVLKMAVEFRLPETTRKADQYAREALLRDKEGL